MDDRLSILAIGAHPDDCDLAAGGTAAKWAALGHRVTFLSVTNGDAGHMTQGGDVAGRRRLEADEAARRIAIEYVVLDHPDGRLTPSLEAREQIIRAIRQAKPDLVLGPRANDYHPDHRAVAVLVQDAAFLVTVPRIVTDAPALRRPPVFAHFEDRFVRPVAFRPDIAVAIDDVFDRKIAMLDAHVSQFYEWLPWLADRLGDVPADAGARRAALARQRTRVLSDAHRKALAKRYGEVFASAVTHAETFEISEYGAPADEATVRRLFPFFP